MRLYSLWVLRAVNMSPIGIIRAIESTMRVVAVTSSWQVGVPSLMLPRGVLCCIAAFVKRFSRYCTPSLVVNIFLFSLLTVSNFFPSGACSSTFWSSRFLILLTSLDILRYLSSLWEVSVDQTGRGPARTLMLMSTSSCSEKLFVRCDVFVVVTMCLLER